MILRFACLLLLALPFAAPRAEAAGIAGRVVTDTGAFQRAGSPWLKVPAATGNTKYFKPAELSWKLRATSDESFLYVQIQADAELPAPKSEVSEAEAKRIETGVNVNWPVMKIRILAPAPREYEFQVAVNIGDRATFGADGKAVTHHHYRAYVFAVRQGERSILDGIGGESPEMAVKGRFIEVRMPLKVLGIARPGSAPIEIDDANSLAKFLPYRVNPFVR